MLDPRSPSSNLILRALPAAERDQLLDRARPVHLQQKDIIYEPHRPIPMVWFPTTGMGSLVTQAREGKDIEALAVGNEGVVGLPVFLDEGRGSGNVRAICQVEMDAFALGAEEFAAIVKRLPSLQRHLLSFTQASLAFASQSALCNRNHELPERCARWLLDAADRVTEKMELTQEFLSQMLGVHRPSVTVAVRTLENAGLIDYERGRVTIINRKELERASCECYGVVRKQYERLIPGYPQPQA